MKRHANLYLIVECNFDSYKDILIDINACILMICCFFCDVNVIVKANKYEG